MSASRPTFEKGTRVGHIRYPKARGTVVSVNADTEVAHVDWAPGTAPSDLGSRVVVHQLVCVSDDNHSAAKSTDSKSPECAREKAAAAARAWRDFGNKLHETAMSLPSNGWNALVESELLPAVSGSDYGFTPEFGLDVTDLREDLLRTKAKAYAIALTYEREAELLADRNSQTDA